MSSLMHTDSVDPKKIKRGMMDKQPPPNCRDYLDMDTDEEEFGRQETPEPDEDLPPEPEKPVFTDEEMDTLVLYVKKLTMLPSLEEYTWPLETIEIIHIYFHCPVNTILTIFFEATECKALLGFPLKAEQGLTYFLRSPWQVYSPENFMSTVIFGCVSGDLEKSVLKFLENMYLPLAVESSEWPRVTKDEIFSNLNKFLMKLTDATYGPLGITMLYIPREGILQKDSETLLPPLERDRKGFIERLERVARYWIKQIRGALRGTDLPPRPSCRTIIEEIAFWNYRFDNLSCVHHQLTSKSVLTIVHTLEQVNSPSIQKFHQLAKEVEEYGSEASSNVMYLNLFVDSCVDFEIPDGIEDYASKILYLIRFVGLESKYYTSEDKISILCRALGTQIIEQCKKYIDLNTILEGDTSNGKLMLENSICCCEKFINIFDRISQMDSLSEQPVISIINKSAYCHVDIFIQRCEDLMEISDARFVYNTCKEVKMIGGARGSIHEAQYKKIESLFSAILENVKEMRDSILDVTTNTWLNKIVEIRCQIQDIDNMVNNLILEIFKDVQNVEEGIEAIYAMKRFVTRKYLQKTLHHYWMIVWKIFEDELESSSVTMQNSVYHSAMTKHAGCAMILRSKSEYLGNQLNMLIDASDWFGDSNIQDKIFHRYKKIQAALTKHELAHFTSWEKQVPTDTQILRILQEPVIKFLPPPEDSFLTVNLDLSYIENMRAVMEWKQLKYDSKCMTSKFLLKLAPIRARYVKIRYLCELYNSIVKRLSEKEILLLENSINEVKNLIIAALPRCTWSTENVEKIYTEWLRNVVILRDLSVAFKSLDGNIDSACEKLQKALLMKNTKIFHQNFDDIKDLLEANKNESLDVMKEASRSIVSNLYALHRKIKYGETTPRNWSIYVTDVIEKFKVSIVKNIQASLKASLNVLREAESCPLFQVDVTLSDEDSIIFTPEPSEIMDLLRKFIPITNDEIYGIDEFSRVLKFGTGGQNDENFIDSNEYINSLRVKIETVIGDISNDLDEFGHSVKTALDRIKSQESLTFKGDVETREMLEDVICRGRRLNFSFRNESSIVRLTS